MKIVKILFRALMTVVAAAIVFCAALILTAVTYDRWYLSRKFPNGHGVVVISAFGPISLGAWACAVLVMIVGIVWTVRAGRSAPAPDCNA